MNKINGVSNLKGVFQILLYISYNSIPYFYYIFHDNNHDNNHNDGIVIVWDNTYAAI